MIKKIILKNFQLFKEADITLNKINIFKGINLDSTNLSSNGSGKSSIAKNAITFCYYGDVLGKHLSNLIHFGAKELYVEIQEVVGNDTIRCIRKQPTDLKIYLNDKEVIGNTNAIKQQFIDEQFGSYDYFKKYRLIDLKGINLLDLCADSRSVVTLKKELMSFVDDLFTGIRKHLLAKKLERETYNVDKRFYKFALSDKRITVINKGLDDIAASYTQFETDRDIQQGIVNKLKSEIQTRERLIANRNYELNEAQKTGICPILKTKCTQITKQITPEQKAKMNAEISKLNNEITQYKLQLENELDAMVYYDATIDRLQAEEIKARECLMKMKEAFKFKDYKYTKQDVMLYDESIKVLDSFAGYYIHEWLGQLSLIMNELLRNVNLKVEFSPEKEFLKIKDGNSDLPYELLSDGQKTFLSAVFRMSILIHKGDNSGLIIADEGLGNLDEANFKDFVEVAKNTNFQFLLIYQDAPDIDGVNYITIERQNGRTIVK